MTGQSPGLCSPFDRRSRYIGISARLLR